MVLGSDSGIATELNDHAAMVEFPSLCEKQGFRLLGVAPDIYRKQAQGMCSASTKRGERLPYWPAALPLFQAASYCGLSVDTFKRVCPMKPIKFTASSRGDRYLRQKLDEWLLSLIENKTVTSTRRFGDRLGAQEIKRRRRGKSLSLA